ncbi:MAG: ribosome maturation factor RimM [Gammaproteobacteria bacterium]|nr:ribosome maturation factor RimM [Gammaproteobacteria bacterium]
MGQHPGIQVGYVQGAFGIKGWLRIHSFCRPKEQILEYASWDLRMGHLENSYQPDQGRLHGHGVVVHLSGIDTRTQAEALKRAQIWVSTVQLPSLPAGEYYWYQLIGLDVKTVAGQGLGRIERLMETGTHDVLVVKDGDSGTEVLIPYLPGDVVKEVDLEHKRMTVDWLLEYS